MKTASEIIVEMEDLKADKADVHLQDLVSISHSEARPTQVRKTNLGL